MGGGGGSTATLATLPEHFERGAPRVGGRRSVRSRMCCWRLGVVGVRASPLGGTYRRLTEGLLRREMCTPARGNDQRDKICGLTVLSGPVSRPLSDLLPPSVLVPSRSAIVDALVIH